ncbi:MAG: squalene synthase HpnD [Acidimicrobiia bacterium]|nr:squalene synthase HpnD [Acidimicrobiia bacterium]
MARKTSFYYSFLVLPPEQRHAIIAVWDFCRAVDDGVDEAASREAAVEAVRFWRDELARCYDGGTPQTTQGLQLRAHLDRFQLPRQPFDDVIAGVAMDLDTMRYETFDDLLEYCHRVASAVGIICIQIFGCEHPSSRQYALDLGVALQLTNILRDIKDDLAKGRVYIPQADLRAAGCRTEDLARGMVTDSVRRVMALECGRAREFYERARRSRPEPDRRRLVAAEIMRAVYFETLQRIERNGYDVFSRRTRVPKPIQATLALRQWMFPQ